MNTCVACGVVIPKGRQVCKRCELINPKELILVLLNERVRRIGKTSFTVLLDVLNVALAALNANGYQIRDPINPDYYVHSIYFDEEQDELYFDSKKS